MSDPTPKPLRWIGSSREDLKSFPKAVRRRVGEALAVAQDGGKSVYAKPLRGFGGAGVLEVVADFDGDTFRAAYTVRLEGAVFVLHVFQKKAKRGAATPRRELRLIETRLKLAVKEHEEWTRRGSPK